MTRLIARDFLGVDALRARPANTASVTFWAETVFPNCRSAVDYIRERRERDLDIKVL